MFWTIENECLSVTVEDLGAQIKSIYSKKYKTEYFWQGSDRYWKGRGYNLFPVVGRLYDGKYTFNGKEYPMGIHGFARNSLFTLCEKDDLKMVFAVSSNDETLKVYPFEFIFKIEYSLEKNRLVVKYIVENKGKEVMYFGLGAHPGFNVPFDGGNFNDYYIEFNSECSPERLLLGPNYLMSGKSTRFELKNDKILRLKHDLFDDDAVILKNSARSLKIKKQGGEKTIEVEFPNMPYLGIWHTVKSDAPFVCIEPWENLPSNEGELQDITEKENIGVLKPLSEYQSEVRITIE